MGGGAPQDVLSPPGPKKRPRCRGGEEPAADGEGAASCWMWAAGGTTAAGRRGSWEGSHVAEVGVGRDGRGGGHRIERGCARLHLSPDRRFRFRFHCRGRGWGRVSRPCKHCARRRAQGPLQVEKDRGGGSSRIPHLTGLRVHGGGRRDLRTDGGRRRRRRSCHRCRVREA